MPDNDSWWSKTGVGQTEGKTPKLEKDELRTENDEVVRKPLLPWCGVNISVSVTFQSFVLRHLEIISDRNIKKLQGMKA